MSAVSDKTRSFNRIASANGTQFTPEQEWITPGNGVTSLFSGTGGPNFSSPTSTTSITDGASGSASDVVDPDEVDDLIEGLAVDSTALTSSSSIAEQEDQVPAIPSSLRTKATATSIHVTWFPPKNSKILVRGYTIGWGIGFPDVYSKVLDGKQRSYTIKDLQPGSEYVISLRAYNNMGDGQPAYDNVRTLQEDSAESALQLFPPVGLKATVLSSSSVVLQWTDTSLPSARQPTDSRVYVVRYTSNFRSSSPKYKYTNSSKTNVLVDELKPSTQYEFAVKVVKGRQESTWSMSVVNTTSESVPSTAPRDLTIVPDPEGNPSNVRLQWQPPKQPNGQVNGYVIFYTTDESKSDRDWSIHPLLGDKMNAVLTNLLPDTNYYFKIQARNEKGTGPLSPSVSFRTASISHSPSSMMNITSKTISTHTLYFVIAAISAVTLVLLLVISLLLCRSKRPVLDSKTRKGGYSSAASSCSSPLTSSGKKRESRQLHPPDLWIHHEQLELKSMEKNHPRDEATPVLRTFQESPVRQITPADCSHPEDRKGITYTSDSLYDDITRTTPSTVVDGTSDLQSSLFPSTATSTIRRTARAKPIMIPATSSADVTSNAFAINTPTVTSINSTSSTSVLEAAAAMAASSGLSRPVYPRTGTTTAYSMVDHNKSLTQFVMGDLVPAYNLYDPVTSNSIQLAYSGANLVCNNSVPSYSSSGNTSSCAMSPTDPSAHSPVGAVSSSLTASSSPSINNLTLRPLPGLQSLRSFALGDGHTLPSTNTPKHIGKCVTLLVSKGQVQGELYLSSSCNCHQETFLPNVTDLSLSALFPLSPTQLSSHK